MACTLPQSSPTVAPLSGLEGLLARWRESPLGRHLVCERTFPARPARTRPLPAWLDQRLVTALGKAGVGSLYEHQAQACEALRRGRNVVVATPTASGKTLCYNLPVFQALLEDPQARAIYLFPTKALARDQVEAARALAAAVDPSLGVAVYDGDTPVDHRRAARQRARIIATNPEMLHTAILPHHPSWAELLSGLRYVVIDELHTYRGVFGGHLANVLRRLLRLCRFHGSTPRVVATSATIANPAELAERLCGAPFELVDESGAPQGERHLVIYNPPLVDPGLGLRESYLMAGCRFARDLCEARLGTLVFCKSRLATEVLLRHLRQAVADDEEPGAEEQRVRGYRGGYLPDRRREVEGALRRGEAGVVVSTSALELGIDIGSLDAVVLIGWPGSRAAFWQRAGRAGRRLAPSLTVLCASSEPLDQYLAADPEFLLGKSPEHAHLDPDNPAILVPHLKCAAFELPFHPGERYGELEADETDEVLGCLVEARMLHRSGGVTRYLGDAFPAAEVSLRGRLAENFLVIDQPGGGKVLAEVDHDDAPEVLFPGAIYQLEGSQWQVARLDHEARKAYVSSVEVDYYTDAITSTRVRILECATAAGCARQGEVHVLHRVSGFKKIKLVTGENVGYGEVSLPDREMHTSAFWLSCSEAGLSALHLGAAEVAEASLALSQVLHAVSALLLLGDRSDLGRAVGDARSGWSAVPASLGGALRPDPGALSALGPFVPTLFLFDRYPGGTGLCERLFERREELLARARRLVERCACRRGCPSCIGPGRMARAKAECLRLIELAEAELARPAAEGEHLLEGAESCARVEAREGGLG